ncbi:MAG: FAD-binding oxidoreductase [Rhodobacterales bacterium]|nr:MAG: FAD-binding oxidoreductase [Rhodobacterales bacterium]
MTLIDRLIEALGAAYVETQDLSAYARDWTGKFDGAPAIVVRPGSTEEVSAVMRIAYDTETPIVPVAGRTGLTGGTHIPGGIQISVERLNQIEEVNPRARTARVGAGVILQDLRDAADAEDMVFPLTFGAQGSCRIGGVLGTNAGGSNVLRYGNTRDLVLGVEVVLADGRVMDLMTALHKNNSGYDLRHLVIGAEGTLGVITRAVVKLFPAPKARATAMVAVPSLDAALTLLNRLQEATDGAVEAFEYMPAAYFDWLAQVHPDTRPPFEARHDVNIMVEIAATADRDCTPLEDGTIPLTNVLEEALGGLMEEGLLDDAVIAQNDQQRREIWARREAAGEVMFTRLPLVDTDIAVPLDKVATFLKEAPKRIRTVDPKVEDMSVAHLGDGNIHYTMYPSADDPALKDRLMETVEGVAQELGGTFSAEHGVGLSKLPSMRRRKDPVALDVMRAVKAAVDPKGILNPGKLVPEVG